MVPLTRAELHAEYVAVKAACALDQRSDAARAALHRLASLSLRFLTTQAERIDLNSPVEGKRYISFRINGVVARPANHAFFLSTLNSFLRLWQSWDAGTISREDLRKLVYTAALAPCLAMELFDRQNKKGPATYFECFVGHIFAKALNQNPAHRIPLQVRGRAVRLTMDFLFDGTNGGPKIHLPVKMSTRERVVQAWAHQALLDSAYGENEYRGVMVLFSETKLDSRSLEVVEICVPDQWLA